MTMTMQTSLLNLYCTFGSITGDPERRRSYNQIYWGQIVGVIEAPEREYDLCIGTTLKHRLILLVRLGTFSKDSVVEVNIEDVRLCDSPGMAREIVSGE